MKIVIGIDVGGSTTKIIGVENGDIRFPMLVTADDPVTSLFGAFGKYLYQNNIKLDEVDKVMLTGVGASNVNQDLYGIPTFHCDEFLANGLGAHYGSDLSDVIVVSMGTGSSFVEVRGEQVKHIGGVSIGGGTITGLASLLLHTNKIQEVLDLATQGNAENVNLLIRDITSQELPGLPPEATASSFGKVCATTLPEDIAAGIIYMVLQSIGQSAIFAAMNTPVKDFVMIGNLTNLPQCRFIFPMLAQMFNVRFLIPEYAEYRTALGAALAGLKKK